MAEHFPRPSSSPLSLVVLDILPCPNVVHYRQGGGGACVPCPNGWTTNVSGGQCESVRWGIEQPSQVSLVYKFPKPNSGAPVNVIRVAPDIVILGGNKRTYESVSITIDKQNIADEDWLEVADKVTNPLPTDVTERFDEATGILTLTGPTTGWEFTRILRRVEYRLGKGSLANGK